MTVQHSHESNEWGTPDCVLWRARGLSGSGEIDFDPCSSAAFNERVKAREYWSEGALERPWPQLPSGLVLVNPPGNAPHEDNMPAMFWSKLQREISAGWIGHAVWVGFTLEHLRHCQNRTLGSLVDYPLCIPRERLQFERPDGTPGTAPGHANVIAYIPGRIDRRDHFYELFRSLGACR